MWKYVAFVLLIIFCVPAVLGQEEKTESVSTSSGAVTTTSVSTTDSSTPSTTGSPTTTPSTTGSPTTTPSTTGSPTTTPSTTGSPTTTPSTTDSPTTTPSTTVSPTTSEPTSTASALTTTPLPPPSVGTYIVHEKDNDTKICIRAQLAIRVDLRSGPYNFVNATTEGSDCGTGNTTIPQILKLNDALSESAITFTFVEEGQKYYVKKIVYGNQTEPEVGNVTGQYFSASTGKSYLCNAETSVRMSENLALIFSSVHMQAFGAQSFGLADECEADDKVGDIVPIAVGCALAALVVIVLIAYLVGRRRSRQRGYQSV